MALKIAALASGRGSNLMTINEMCRQSKIDGEIVLALSNNPEAKVVKSAKAEGLKIWAENHKDYPDRKSFDKAMMTAIDESGADTIALCGYMRLLSPEFIKAYPGRILNVHPAILPSFPGVQGGRDAYLYGVRFTGCTVHFVTEEMDTGPIIIQGIIALSSTEKEEDFMPRLHALEHKIYPQALQWLAEDRLKLEGRRVILKNENKDGKYCLMDEEGQKLKGAMISPPLEIF